jgi:transposase InsO family protein
MHYQDHLAKFSILRPLKSKRAAEVAYQLTDIFLLLGAPHILQNDNGREFTANIIIELKLLRPELKLVHRRPRHPQIQGSVERTNDDIKSMIISWTHENNNTHWSEGLRFVQFQKQHIVS